MKEFSRALGFLIFFLIIGQSLFAQDDLLKLVNDSTKKKEYVTGAFKSTRVINGQSIEFLGNGVLDVRILHRFGKINEEFVGLDGAKMRLGLDYGITKNFMIGIGRSTFDREWDAFLKFRPVRQSSGQGGIPFSVVLVAGITVNSYKSNLVPQTYSFSDRTGFYDEVIIGRKFSQRLSLQLSPIFVHQNKIILSNDVATDSNKIAYYLTTNQNPQTSDANIFALGIGARFKVSKRVAFVVDYHHVLSGLHANYYDPLSVGFDIETGGHVFQLHFSNAEGMNERAFLTETHYKWGGDIRFGFNLSRVFTLKKSKEGKEDKKW